MLDILTGGRADERWKKLSPGMFLAQQTKKAAIPLGRGRGRGKIWLRGGGGAYLI